MKSRFNKLVFGAGVFALVFAQIGLGQQNCVQGQTNGAGVVIYLDAGHDAHHQGAKGNGIREEVANLKIALACKAELERYDGVTVVMCREEEACPHAGYSSGGDNSLRVQEAAESEADLYVALHLNYSPRRSIHGAEVYYPNENYNKAVSLEGEAVSASIMAELTGLGIKNNGIQPRTTRSCMRYEDGSRTDYYQVIRESKNYGFPGIIVEHGYVSNASDASKYLNTDEKLARLGVADATGIAKYYGLTLKDPSALSLYRVRQLDNGSVLVYWEERENIDSYMVYRRLEGSLEWELLGATTDPIYNDTAVINGGTYYYTVQAYSSLTNTYSGCNMQGLKITTNIME